MNPGVLIDPLGRKVGITGALGQQNRANGNHSQLAS
jgi:hypothetical protein